MADLGILYFMIMMTLLWGEKMQMDLKEDLLEVLDDAVEFLSMTEADAVAYGYLLDLRHPSVCLPVPGGWRIVTLSTLTQGEETEVLSHELGHLLLLGEGLARVNLGEEEPEKVLAEEINNVVAHRFLIPRLANHYQISSDLPLRLRASMLEEGEEQIRELAGEKMMLHAFGLYLLDLAETVEEIRGRVRDLLTLSAEVQASYEAGQEYLLYPMANIPVEEQYERIKAYLERLDYQTDLLRLCG